MTDRLHTLKLAFLGCTMLLFGLAACNQESGPTTNADGEAPSESNVSTPRLPTTLFASAPTEDAVSLGDAKASAKEGDLVTVEARIGGRKEPFIANRALFYVVDSSLVACSDMEEDHCATPWDYCCEPRDSLLENIGTVQVVGADGMPLKLSIEGEHGLAPLKAVVVTGTVAQRDDAGNFVINATTIHLIGG